VDRLSIFETASAMREAVDGWRASGEQVALVPTMGALHEGHLSLVEAGRRHASRIIVSIFVNPTQFGPNEDFQKYPRSFEDDCCKLMASQVDAVYFPSVGEMYPADFATTVRVVGPAAVGLEDQFRPGHFEGVATVCCKLFAQSRADFVVFGEKDFQQLKVVTRMASDLGLGTRVIPVETLREPDGLAVSSRNRYLTAEERYQAPTLHRVMQNLAANIRLRKSVAQAISAARDELTASGFAVDYLEVRGAETLEPVSSLT